MVFKSVWIKPRDDCGTNHYMNCSDLFGFASVKWYGGSRFLSHSRKSLVDPSGLVLPDATNQQSQFVWPRSASLNRVDVQLERFA